MLTLHRSNRVEALAERLCAELTTPLGNPLQTEVLVVQSLGMRRWLSFALARHFGVAMNCRFPFFAEFSRDIFRAAFGTAAEGEAFTREVLPWRVLSALEELWDRPELEPVRRYVSEDAASEIKRFQVARQIAGVFDRYMAFKPELLLEWENGRGGEWQELLWRRLAQSGAGPHPPQLLQRLAAGLATPVDWPERISVFGIASLPSFYVHLLETVSRHTAVQFYLFEPTDQFWSDLVTPRAKRRLSGSGRPSPPVEDLHYETGNELLTAWGKAGQAFARTVADLDLVQEEPHFVAPEGESVLARVQRAIFEVRSAAECAESAQPDPAERDLSLQIHCVHSPMRELEVLHDRLLELFERLPGLTPKDVLVTMPDVQTYAPFIEAVFGAPEDERMRIPFTIADRSAAHRSPVARTFLHLLELPEQRCTAAEVLELLETPAVREQFGFAESDLEALRDGVERNGIRWGIDGAHRASFGLPAFEQNSWNAGLESWLLGYAMLDEGEQTYHGRLPDQEVEGEAALLAGRLAEMVEELFMLVRGLTRPRTLAEWGQTFNRLLTAFFRESDAVSDELRVLRETFDQLGEMAVWHAGEVTFEAVRTHLQEALSDTERASGFLAGHATFCSLKPMRSIPFRVVCALGLNDGAFPRREIPVAFDLLAEEQRAPGRSRRDEDRQLFLEALLSAREVFYVSYVGRSPSDNSERPPSTVVSELLEHLEALAPGRREHGKLEAGWVLQHPLHGFSHQYFAGRRDLFSYSREQAETHEARQRGSRKAPASWLDARLPPPEPEEKQVELEQFIRFFKNPPKFFVRERLRVRLPEAEEALAEHEPLLLDSLDEWKVLDRLARAMLEERRDEGVAAVEAAGVLPAGYFGRAKLARLEKGMDALQSRLSALPLGPRRAAVPINLRLGEWTLHGVLTKVYEAGQLAVSGSAISPKLRLEAWIKHLALLAAEGGERTALIGAEGAHFHHRQEDAIEQLTALLALYEEGLQAPVPFFPKSSFEFARRTLAPKKRETGDPAMMAREKNAAAEALDPAFRFCFPEGDAAYGPEWQRIALLVWGGVVGDLENQWAPP